MSNSNRLDWYDFSESYLLKADIDLLSKTFTIQIDARKTYSNPRVNNISNYDDYFEKINLVFSGIHYYRCAMNDNLIVDDDLGGIYCLKIRNQCKSDSNDGVLFKKHKNYTEIVLTSNSKEISSNHTEERNIEFLELFCENISIILAFSNYELTIL